MIFPRSARRAAVAALVVALVSALTVIIPARAARATSFESTPASSWQTDAAGRVYAITSIGDVVYVGGNFTGVRPDGNTALSSQPHLAAFDAITGDHLATFAPDLDGEVRALVPSDDGATLYVGGSFINVNGIERRGVVALDPTTGALDPAFTRKVNGNPTVNDLDIDGDWLYLAGGFGSISGQARAGLARINLATDSVDNAWAPSASNGAPMAIKAAPFAGRVYVGGFFTAIDGVADTDYFVALDDNTGAHDATFDVAPGTEVIDIDADIDRVYAALGGIGGRFDIHEAPTGFRVTSHAGDGDVQAAEIVGDRVYAGGHFIEGLGAGENALVESIDRVTTAVDTSFAPVLRTPDNGVWALHEAAGHLWVGGSMRIGPSNDLIGFTRYTALPAGPADVTPPTQPSALVDDAVYDTRVELSWGASTDDSGLLFYRVIRDGVVIGNTLETTYLDQTVSPLTTYTYQIVAVDPASNQSTPSNAVTVSTLGPTTPLTAFELGSSWRYLDGPAPAPADWASTQFDDAAWPSGPAPLGYNEDDTATTVATHGNGNKTTWFRTTVEVPAGKTVVTADLDLRRDDGAVVHVNGVEVLRSNMPAGPITNATEASSSVFGFFEDEVLSFDISDAPFTAGTNVVAVEIHNRGIVDLTFDAALELGVADVVGNPPPPPPPAPLTLPATVVAPSAGGWKTSADGSTPPAAWNTIAFDDAAWADSITELGRGDGDENTVIANQLVTWHRQSFTIADPAPITSLELALLADDGAIVHLNGTEVVRDNVAAGAVTSTTPAQTSRWGAAEREWRTFAIPAGLLVAGENVVAISLHNRVGSSDLSLDAELIADDGAAAPTTTTVIAASDAGWLTSADGTVPAATWTTVGFDDAAWAQTTTELGFGDGDENTVIANQLVTWHRHDFTIAGAASVTDVTLELLADDGAVVHLNGTEVARDNVAAGPVDENTPAASSRWGSAEREWRTFTLPASALQDGANVLAISLHNRAGSSDLSLDAELRVTG